MLTTPFLGAQIARNGVAFAERRLFINNVRDTAQVVGHAERLVSEGVLTGYYIVDEHADEALRFFRVTRDGLGSGYVYSVAELVSIYLCRTPYLLHYSGDSILERDGGWIHHALDEFLRNEVAAVANPAWDEGFSEAASESYDRNERFFVGYGFSDQCYLIRTSDFRAPIYGESNAFSERYPAYGGELFEKRVDAWMRNHRRTRVTHRASWYRHLRGADHVDYCRRLSR